MSDEKMYEFDKTIRASQVLTLMNAAISKRVVLDAGMVSGLAATSQDWPLFFGFTILAEKTLVRGAS